MKPGVPKHSRNRAGLPESATARESLSNGLANVPGRGSTLARSCSLLYTTPRIMQLFRLSTIRLATVLSLVPLLNAGEPESKPNSPRLVLQITVDQLRGDLPLRMLDRFGEGGFRYLMDEGMHYLEADYAHGTTHTASGHATLFTGANPREHGIIANEWFDPERGMTVYNCEDMEHALLGEVPRVGAGTSPKLLKSSTIGDELVISSGGHSRTFAVSVKDRGAILPAGHLGKAFWFSSSKGQFVTSDYYYEDYPDWASEWNSRGIPDSYGGTSWELMADPASYLFEDDREYERSRGTLGKTFPKLYGEKTGPGLYSMLTTSPAGDELVLSFVQAMVEAEGIGQGTATDFLAVSFSATDYVGHIWGPSSREAEDNLLRLDRTLAGLLEFVDEKVGLENTVIVLCADHGAPDAPESLSVHGRAVDWVDDSEMLKSVNRDLKEHFGCEDSLIQAMVIPYIYLDQSAIGELQLEEREVLNVLTTSLEAFPGIAHAVPRWRFEDGALPDSPLYERLGAAFHGSRSGDVMLVTEPQWLIGSGNPRAFLASLHGSPWRYDTHVPIMIMGPGITSGSSSRPVSPRDIAPTLAVLLGIKTPGVATGRALFEALSR
ncbi:MAG: hypothetical protein ACI9F9_000082 [Candidatus Paceibacteria bacterium]|jgi:hypothetical protein